MENWLAVDSVSSLNGKDVTDHTQETRLVPQGAESGPTNHSQRFPDISDVMGVPEYR